MIEISEELKELCNKKNIPKKYTIYFPELSLTINNDQIVNNTFSLDENLCSDEDLVFGSCEASKVKFTLADIQADIKGKTFTLTQTVNNTYSLPLGIYTVDSVTRQDNLRFKEVVAYDVITKSDVDVTDWYNGLSFPLTLAAFRASLLNHLGIEEELKTLPNDGMLVTKTIEPSQISGRDVLKACEEINGCFGHINRYGKFAHIVLEHSYGLYPAVTLLPADVLFPVSENDTSYFEQTSAATQVSTAMCQSVRFEEYTVKEIDKLQIRQEEGDIGAIVGTGSNAYIIEGNFLVYGKSAAELNTIAINAFGNIQKRPYRPYQSSNIGLPYIEVGDTIAFDLDDVVAGYVFKRSLTGIQALRDAFTAEGNDEAREQNFSVNKQIIQLQGKSAVLKRTVEELSSTITDVEAGLQSQITQTAGQLQTQITDTESGLQSQITQTASSLQTQITDSANNLQSQINQQADSIELKVDADGVISSINLSGEGIKINANKLELTSYVTFNNLETPGQTIIDGGNLKTGTVVADSVKSSWVYANNINADQVNAGVLQSMRIENDDIYMDGDTIQFHTGGAIKRSSSNNWSTTNRYLDNVISFASQAIQIGQYSGNLNNKLNIPMEEINIGYSGSYTYSDINMYGGVRMWGRIGFFGTSLHSKTSVSDLSTSATLSTTISKLNELLNVLQGYGLV